MTSLESHSYARVVVISPSTRIDLALPADVAIIDLLPMLLQYAGETRADGGGDHGGWKLMRVGHGELDGGRTLRSSDVGDGEVLRLTAREERVVVPVFDDVVDAVAAARGERINRRSANPGLGAGVIVAALAVAALTLYTRRMSTEGAYLAGGIALALLALATATAQGSRERIVATATAAGGIPFAVVCGVIAVPGHPGHWGVLLGASLAFGYSLAATVALGTGAIVFSGAATAAVFVAFSALAAGLVHVSPVRVVAATIAVALAALSLLPRVAIRLARLPLATVPTDGDDSPEADELGDIDEVMARARLAGEYVTGTQIGCAVTIGSSALVLGTHAAAMSVGLAATASVAMALRARSVAGLGARIALVGSAVAAGVFSAGELVVTNRDDNGVALLAIELAVALLALVITTARTRRPGSPQTIRLVEFVESGAIIAVLPLAAGVLGLYTALRRL